MITGVKTATGNRRYTEKSVLAAMNGSGDADEISIVKPKASIATSRRKERVNRHTGAGGRRAVIRKRALLENLDAQQCRPRPQFIEGQSYGETGQQAQSNHRSPDDAYTSWDKDRQRARAELEITRLKHDKYALDTSFEDQRTRRQAKKENEERRQRELDWLTRIKQAGIAYAREAHIIPEEIALRKVPPSILRKISNALEETITLSTCPLPAHRLIREPGNSDIKLAKQCADEFIQPWIQEQVEVYRAKKKPLFYSNDAHDEQDDDFDDDNDDDWEDDDPEFGDDDEQEEYYDEDDNEDEDEW